MIVKKHQVFKSIFLFAFSIISSLSLFITCLTIDDDLAKPELTFYSDGEFVYEKEAGSKTIELKSNKDWSVTKGADADWISISPKSGLKGTTKLTVNADSNDGEARECTFKITASSIDKTITISQKAVDASELYYTTIEEIRTMYAEHGQEKWIITQPLYLKGVVISDRVGGNRPSQRDGYIQDNARNGLAFRVTQSTNLFEMGDELIINLEGSTLLNYGGVLQLNFSDKTVKVEAHGVYITPEKHTIKEILNGSFDGTLVKIEDVQFETYKDLCYYETGLATIHKLVSCNDANILVKTTKYANFKDKFLPAGKGNIIGIMSMNNGTWHLMPRNLDDVKEMSNDESTRCTPNVVPVTETKISIADFRSSISEGDTYTKESYLEGEVILNSYKANVPDHIVYIADNTAGITLSFSDKENILINVPIGAKVKAHIKNTKSKVLNGQLQIGYNNSLATQDVDIVEKISSTPLHPKVTTIDEILAGKYESDLVKIENVQFKNIGAKYADSTYIINEVKKKIQVTTSREADFANEFVKEGMGTLVAVVTVNNLPQMLIRSMDDLSDMTNNRFVDSFIAIEKNAIVYPEKGGNETINITANVNWIASSDKSWLTINPKNGSSNGAITALANENQAEERKATITITDGTITKSIIITQKAKVTVSNKATDLFFSEYIEGSSNNKYLEIYNGTGITVDLSDYKIELYVNGNTTVKSTEILTGTLGNSKVAIFKHSKAAIYDGEATISSAINYNGNDAIALVKISTDTYVDIIGTIGHDPGKKGWIDPSNEDLTTMDKTLVRKPSIYGGVSVNPKNAFPTLGKEWISFPIDTVDFLGSHTMN